MRDFFDLQALLFNLDHPVSTFQGFTHWADLWHPVQASWYSNVSGNSGGCCHLVGVPIGCLVPWMCLILCVCYVKSPALCGRAMLILWVSLLSGPGMGNPQLSVSENTFPGVLSPGTSSKVPWAGGLWAGLPALWTQWEEGQQSACWSVGFQPGPHPQPLVSASLS